MRVQEEPTAAYSPSPPPTSPAQLSRIATTRGPTRQPTLAKEARPDASAIVETIERQKTRVSTEVNDRMPQVLTVPSIPIERERKPSTAAPGIAAPPPQMVQRDRKPTEVEKKPRRKAPNYPPERQYPPAPAYPVRETPAWTKPDTHTSPPQPKVEPVPKKRGIFGLGSKSKEEPKPVQQSAPEPRYRQPEPHRDRSDRYQDSLGERYKGQEVIQPYLDTSPSIELQLRSPSEGMIIIHELLPSTLARTITTPDSHQSFRTAETTIRQPKIHLSGVTSSHRRKLRPLEEMSAHSPTILQPQPVGIIPRTIKTSPEPGRTPPIATKLASNPFVAKRRSPLAVNLRRNKTFVTKRRPLFGLKRLHLNVGRRLTKNPFARAQYRKRRLSQGLSAETPAVTPKQGILRFRRSNRQSQGTSQQRVTAGKVVQYRKQKRAMRKTMGIPIPSLLRKTRETPPAVTVSMVSVPPMPNPESRAIMQVLPQIQTEERQPRLQMEVDHQRLVRERQRPSPEPQSVQVLEDERQRQQQLPRQRERHQRLDRGDLQQHLEDRGRSADRQLQDRTRELAFPREPQRVQRDQRSQPIRETPFDEHQRRQVRQSRERQIQEPLDRERQYRQRAPGSHQQQNSELETQPRLRRQRTPDQSQQGRQQAYRAAAHQCHSTTRARQTHTQYPSVQHPQSQTQSQAERIQFLPRTPQPEVGSEARERSKQLNDRQPRQPRVEQDETQVRRRIRGQEQVRESSQRDSNTNNSRGKSGPRLYREVWG
ncbi:hypothetical protein EJ07DRAFT_170363 [Lizonia empirigonia]|nr:hypothetical protein EJ07DRAFT_170363 [Lizonia empirigonia]